MRYMLYSCGASLEIEADNLQAARKEAREWVREGDYGDIESTIWINCRIEQNGETSDTWDDQITVSIDPEEPLCMDDESHDWQSPYDIVGGCEENPGVWGNGGGVIIHEVCMKCGAVKTINTWAQNSKSGEQGLTSLSYENSGYYDDR